MKWHYLMVSVAILLLTVSCSSVTSSPSLSSQKLASNADASLVLIAPEIPYSREDAFYPLRRGKDGKILPSYQWRECVKKFVVCLKWETRRVEFVDLEWFYANGFGLSKRRRPGK